MKRATVRHYAISSWYLDVSGVFDITSFTTIAGVRPTHCYTPDRCVPAYFEVARKSASPSEPCCWQYRTKLSKSLLPDKGMNLLLRKFSSKAVQIERFCKGKSITPIVGVSIDAEGDPDPAVWCSREGVQFCADIGGRFEISILATSAPSNPHAIPKHYRDLRKSDIDLGSFVR